jgi:hypothetical protein
VKKGRVFFNPIEGSGSLTISFSSGPKGDAIEAKRGDGVGFFSEKGDLLCVIFDEVQSDEDHQTLVFAHDRIEISTKNGRVTYIATKKQIVPGLRRRLSSRKKTAK